MTSARLLALIALTLAAATSAQSRAPNIIVVFTDDHGYSDLSCQGIVDDIRTPHIDRLASGGARMTSGYVTAPQCVPSRAGLLSGRYQNRFGVESNGQPLDGFNAEPTVAERLQQAGYATGMTGKWHLGPAGEIVDHGFDDVFYQGGSWTNFDLRGNDVPPGSQTKGVYHIDAGSAAARAFIKRHHDQPFFLYVAYRAPHVPLDATEKYLQRFPGEMPQRRRQALAMISAIDDGVGGIVDALREYDIEEQTLIFFIGDNGAPLKIHKLDAPGGGPGWDGSFNDPLNGEKGMLSEGGIRVPFVVYWKGRIQPGQVYPHPVISLDVLATAIALAGLPADPEIDGVNLIPYLSGEIDGPPHETLYWRWIAQSAIREGDWKYLRGGAREYLFNVATDREEKHDLLAEHGEIADRLRAKLARWSETLRPPGMETKSMSQTWEQYYDFYLDGKPAPKLAKRANAGSDTRQGWVARNAEFQQRDGLVRVSPGSRKGPFIAANGLSLPPESEIVLRMRASRAGIGRIAWRESGQKDFTPEHAVKFECQATNELTQHRVTLPADNKIIHLRLHLPAGSTDIASIECYDSDGKPIRKWKFE